MTFLNFILFFILGLPPIYTLDTFLFSLLGFIQSLVSDKCPEGNLSCAPCWSRDFRWQREGWKKGQGMGETVSLGQHLVRRQLSGLHSISMAQPAPWARLGLAYCFILTVDHWSHMLGRPKRKQLKRSWCLAQLCSKFNPPRKHFRPEHFSFLVQKIHIYPAEKAALVLWLRYK